MDTRKGDALTLSAEKEKLEKELTAIQEMCIRDRIMTGTGSGYIGNGCVLNPFAGITLLYLHDSFPTRRSSDLNYTQMEVESWFLQLLI